TFISRCLNSLDHLAKTASRITLNQLSSGAVGCDRLLKVGGELLVPRGQELVLVLNKERRFSTVQGTANRMGTSREGVDVSAVGPCFDNLDGKILCLWEKQSFKIASVRSVQCGTLLAVKKSNHF